MATVRRIGIVILIGVALTAVQAQSPQPAATSNVPETQDTALRSAYKLAPEDVIVIRALEIEEINEKTIRIDRSGNIHLPLVGRVHVEGMTTDQCENALADRMKEFIRHPQIAVSITEFHSATVSVLGAVNAPGVHPVQGRKTLVEVISLAGGLKDDAGPALKITRRLKWGSIPLANATNDPTNQVSVAEVSLKSIIEAKSPLDNITVCPDDVISVPRADMVYVIGEVMKPGGYVLRERSSISVLQAVSMAGGISHTAGPKGAKILRVVAANTERQEIPIDLKQILSGHKGDVKLLPEDILLVPNNLPKNVALRGLEAAISIGTGLAIYRP
jgi:polysaccharide export outer membrane protein